MKETGLNTHLYQKSGHVCWTERLSNGKNRESSKSFTTA